jgi:hypothetical protein
MNPAPLLILLSLWLMVMRFYQPGIAKPAGTIVRKYRVPLMARVRLQRANVYAVGAILVIGGIGGWLPPAIQLLIAAVVVILLFLPVDYTITGEGIALGRTRTRLWSEFASAERQGGRVNLKAIEGEAGMSVWLPGAPADGAVEIELRRLVGSWVAPTNLDCRVRHRPAPRVHQQRPN